VILETKWWCRNQGRAVYTRAMPIHSERPNPDDHLPYFSRYVDLVPEAEIVAFLRADFERLFARLNALRPDQARHRYAPDKWSVQQVIGHLSDTERVFAYRAAHVARGDVTPLPSFDQEIWNAHVDFDARDWQGLLLEWRSVRGASLSLFANLSIEAWSRRTSISGHPTTPRACAYIIAGHALHHERKLEADYGVLG
jgi:DinB superfamily